LKRRRFGIFGDGATSVSFFDRQEFICLSEIPHFDPYSLPVQGQGFVNGVEDMSYASTRSIGIKAGINFNA
jgi:hypothetical protein